LHSEPELRQCQLRLRRRAPAAEAPSALALLPRRRCRRPPRPQLDLHPYLLDSATPHRLRRPPRQWRAAVTEARARLVASTKPARQARLLLVHPSLLQRLVPLRAVEALRLLSPLPLPLRRAAAEAAVHLLDSAQRAQLRSRAAPRVALAVSRRAQTRAVGSRVGVAARAQHRRVRAVVVPVAVRRPLAPLVASATTQPAAAAHRALRSAPVAVHRRDLPRSQALASRLVNRERVVRRRGRCRKLGEGAVGATSRGGRYCERGARARERSASWGMSIRSSR
jgi:hypothetical protein